MNHRRFLVVLSCCVGLGLACSDYQPGVGPVVESLILDGSICLAGRQTNGECRQDGGADAGSGGGEYGSLGK